MVESYFVIGGEGFLGSTIVKTLRQKYPDALVTSFDIVQRHFPEKREWTFVSGDLTSLDDLTSAFNKVNATTVFHTASPWTGSGKAVCEKVNVQGTKTIVEACTIVDSVKKLVFTSSAGTVYNGNHITNGDERLPFPKEAMDDYNVTKGLAENAVLEANGRNGLLTVAIRPSGIFGPGDRQAIPGLIDVLKSGKAHFQVGDNANLFDWTYVDNVVHGHLLAAVKLGTSVPVESFQKRLWPVDIDVPVRDLPTTLHRPESLLAEELKFNPSFVNNPVPDQKLNKIVHKFDQFYELSQVPAEESLAIRSVAGQAFFITNGEPMYFWDFARAVWYEYNGYKGDSNWVIPTWLGLTIASIGETVMGLLGKTPNMTRAKVTYSATDRYYSIERARRVLGYEPIVSISEGIKRAVAVYKENESLNVQK